jgi:drug/metabolite transporter (DMT)-like permease
MLVVCCLCWGLSFPLMPLVMSSLHAAGEAARGATINGWRYLIAAALLAVAMRGMPSRADLRGGLVMGGFMACGMFLQILGLSWVVPSVSGMITALPVLLTPVAQSLILRRAVPIRVWVASAVAVVGCLVLTLGATEAQSAGSLVSPPPIAHAGEIVTALAALCFTGMILAIDHHGPRCDATRMTVVMFLVVGMVNIAIALAVGGIVLHDRVAITAVLGEPRWIAAMAALVVFSSIGAFWLMNRAQPALTPARAAVIYCLEPVFAVIFSLLLGQERLTAATLSGGALVMGAALLATMPGKAGQAAPQPARDS